MPGHEEYSTGVKSRSESHGSPRSARTRYGLDQEEPHAAPGQVVAHRKARLAISDDERVERCTPSVHLKGAMGAVGAVGDQSSGGGAEQVVAEVGGRHQARGERIAMEEEHVVTRVRCPGVDQSRLACQTVLPARSCPSGP